MNSQQKYESSSPTGTLSAHSIRTYINFHKRLGTSSAPLRPLISGKKIQNGGRIELSKVCKSLDKPAPVFSSLGASFADKDY